MTISVTITQPNVTDSYGRVLVVGTTYLLGDDLAKSLIGQGKATATLVSAYPMLAFPPFENYQPGIVAGLLTDNTAAAATANTAAIQAALNAGGLVQITQPGTYYINATLTIPSNTRLTLANGVTIKLFANAACNMIRNTNYNATMQNVTSVTTSDGKTVTVVVAASTTFSVGDYAFIIGAAQDLYNGVWQITSVSTTTNANDTFTFVLSSHLNTEAPLPTSPATINAAYSGASLTIKVSKADANILIEGGTWDWNLANNGGVNSQNAFGLYLRRVYNLTVRDAVFVNCRNAIVPANVYGAYFDNIAAYNVGSTIQICGSARWIRCGTVRGSTWDDHVSCLIGDYPGYATPANGVWYGDIDAVVIGNLVGENAFRFYKAVGQANFKFGAIHIGTLIGRAGMGASSIVTLSDDTGIVNIANTVGASGGNFDDFSIGEFIVRDPTDCFYLELNAVTINQFSMRMMEAALDNSTNCRAVSLSNGCNVKTAQISTLNVYASSLAYSGNASGVVQDATLGQISIDSLFAKNIGYAYLQGSSATNNSIININTLNTNNCGQGVVIKKNGTILSVANAIRNGYQSSPFFQLDGNTEFNCLSGKGLMATDAFGGSAASKTLYNFVGCGVDVGGTGIVRQAGAIGMHYTGTPRGTLVNNNLVVCDATGAANSWKQLSDTTKTY